MLPRPARYFPVDSAPLKMQAGLMKLGTDLGNGPRDALFFQRDDEAPRYRAAKHRAEREGFAAPIERLIVSSVSDTKLARSVSDTEMAAHEAVARWMLGTLAREAPELAGSLSADASSPIDVYRAVAAEVQEDFAVLRRDGEADRAIALSVCFPSGWRPERLAGASFEEIHRPVPRFAKTPVVAKSMVSSMIDRGPYVRFVWTLSADDVLDHHPEEGRRAPWTDETTGFFRVERQLTVPFADVSTALFLIRTYVYPLASLTTIELDTLAAAMRAMPDDVAEYKGLARWTGQIHRAIEVAKRQVG